MCSFIMTKLVFCWLLLGLAASEKRGYPYGCIRVDSGFGYEGSETVEDCTTGIGRGLFGFNPFVEAPMKPIKKMVRTNYTGFHLKHLQRAFGVQPFNETRYFFGRELLERLRKSEQFDYLLKQPILLSFQALLLRKRETDPDHSCIHPEFTDTVVTEKNYKNMVCKDHNNTKLALNRIAQKFQRVLDRTKSCRNPYGMFDTPKCFKYGPKGAFWEESCRHIEKCIDSDPVTKEVLKYTPSGREIDVDNVLTWPGLPPFTLLKSDPTLEPVGAVRANSINEIMYKGEQLTTLIKTQSRYETNTVLVQNARYRPEYEAHYQCNQYPGGYLPIRNKIFEDFPRAFVVNGGCKHAHWIEADLELGNSFQFFAQQYSDVTVGDLFLQFRYTPDDRDGGFNIGLTPYYGLEHTNYILELRPGHIPQITNYLVRNMTDYFHQHVEHFADEEFPIGPDYQLKFKYSDRILVPGEVNRFEINYDHRKIVLKIIKGTQATVVLHMERRFTSPIYPKWVRFCSQTIHRVGIMGPPSVPIGLIATSREEFSERSDTGKQDTGYPDQTRIQFFINPETKSVTNNYLRPFYETRIETSLDSYQITFSFEYVPIGTMKPKFLLFTLFPHLYESPRINKADVLAVKVEPPFDVIFSYATNMRKADSGAQFKNRELLNPLKKNYFIVHMTGKIVSIYFEHNEKMLLYQESVFSSIIPPFRYAYFDARLSHGPFKFRHAGITRTWEKLRIRSNTCVPRRPVNTYEGLYYRGTVDYGYTKDGILDTCEAWHFQKENLMDYNYCRNYHDDDYPELDKTMGLQCIGINTKKILKCKDYCLEMPALSLTGYEYLGDVAISRSGRPCVPATSNGPKTSGRCEGDPTDWGSKMGPVCWVQTIDQTDMKDVHVKESCDVKQAFTFKVKGDAYEIISNNENEWLDLFAAQSGTFNIKIFPFEHWSKTVGLRFNFLTVNGAKIHDMTHYFAKVQFSHEIIIEMNKDKVDLYKILLDDQKQLIYTHSGKGVFSQLRYFYIESIKPTRRGQLAIAPRLGIHHYSDMCPRIAILDRISHLRRVNLMQKYDIDIIEGDILSLNFYNYPDIENVSPLLTLKLGLSQSKDASIAMSSQKSNVKLSDERTFKSFSFEILKMTLDLWLELSSQMCPDVYGYPVSKKKSLQYLSSVNYRSLAMNEGLLNDYLRKKSLPPLKEIDNNCKIPAVIDEWVLLIRSFEDNSVMVVINVKGTRNINTAEIEFFNIETHGKRVALNLIRGNCKRSNVSFAVGKDGEWKKEVGECRIGANGLGIRSTFYTCVGVSAFGSTCKEPNDKSKIVRADFPNTFETNDFCGNLKDGDDNALNKELKRLKSQHAVKIFEEGESGVLVCNKMIKEMIDGNDAFTGTAKYCWYKDSVPLDAVDVKLDNITYSDMGLYQCFVQIGIGKLHPITTVGVIVKGYFKLGLTKHKLHLGVDISAYRTHVNPKQEVMWIFEPSHARNETTKVSSTAYLSTEYSKEKDGVYTACMADIKPMLCFYRVKMRHSSPFVMNVHETVFTSWQNIKEMVVFLDILKSWTIICISLLLAQFLWTGSFVYLANYLKRLIYSHGWQNIFGPPQPKFDTEDKSHQGTGSLSKTFKIVRFGEVPPLPRREQPKIKVLIEKNPEKSPREFPSDMSELTSSDLKNDRICQEVDVNEQRLSTFDVCPREDRVSKKYSKNIFSRIKKGLMKPFLPVKYHSEETMVISCTEDNFPEILTQLKERLNEVSKIIPMAEHSDQK